MHETCAAEALTALHGVDGVIGVIVVRRSSEPPPSQVAQHGLGLHGPRDQPAPADRPKQARGTRGLGPVEFPAGKPGRRQVGAGQAAEAFNLIQHKEATNLTREALLKNVKGEGKQQGGLVACAVIGRSEARSERKYRFSGKQAWTAACVLLQTKSTRSFWTLRPVIRLLRAESQSHFHNEVRPWARERDCPKLAVRSLAGNHTRPTPSTTEYCSGLHVNSVGYDHIDLKEAAARGIRVGHTPDVLTDAVAEISVALALMAARRLGKVGMWAAFRDSTLWLNESWAPTAHLGMQMTNKTVGIIGLGRIGLAVAHRIKPFTGGTPILYYSRTEHPELATQLSPPAVYISALQELLSSSDIVFVCCALTDQTRGLFDEKTFQHM
ncbi:MAG: D-isomer specific 2-hydroxyacid dehydrogenase, partial [Olpidium bornovanus]